MTDRPERCSECKWWTANGVCHRLPPRPSTPNELDAGDCRAKDNLNLWLCDLTVWPITAASEICGEYASKEELQ